ncbi:MAG: sigma-70 family RNA polymerase sigma factor [Pelagimonas sp.]|uniref:sigma-70 family RNA polymerase sigma factor n=1 Tax=Pelagimonas sp. TaxID=2073170 RepID=UPI003D6B1A3D
MQSDPELILLEQEIAKIAKGDRRALRRLFNMVSPQLFGVCCGILNDESVAEDVLEEVFLRVWTWAGQMRPNGSSAVTWLVTLARDASVERLRQMRNEGEIGSPPEIAQRLYRPAATSVPGSAGPAGSARAEADQLLACLAELPRDQTQVMRNAYVQGLTYDNQSKDAHALRCAVRKGILQLRECLSR